MHEKGDILNAPAVLSDLYANQRLEDMFQTGDSTQVPFLEAWPSQKPEQYCFITPGSRVARMRILISITGGVALFIECILTF